MAGPARNVAERVAAVETDTLESVFGILHNGMRMERARRLEDLWSHIHCLGILAETGSFTAAALRLQLSKASVSQRIAELEKAVGLPLVRRTTRRQPDRGGRAPGRADRRRVPAHRGGLLGREGPVGRAPGRAGHDGAGGAGAAGHRAADSGVPQALPGRADPAGPERPAGRAGHRGFRPGDPARGRGARHACGFADRRDTFGAGRHASVPGRARHACRAGGSGAARLHPLPAALGRGCLGVPASGADERVQVPVRGSFAANNNEVLREAALGSVGIALLPDFSAGRRCATGHWSRCWAIGGWKATSPTGCTRSGPIRRMCRAWCPCSSSMSGRPCPRLKHSRSLPSQSVGQRPVMRPGHGPGLGDAAQAQLPVKTRAGVLVQRGDMRQVDDGRAMNAGK